MQVFLSVKFDQVTLLTAWVLSLQVPAVPGTKVVDVTGCGNAFCGGFLAAQHAGVDLSESGMWGCVAGSVMAEWQGVPPADVQQLVQTASERFGKLQQSGTQRYELNLDSMQQPCRHAQVSCSGTAAVGSTSSSAVFSTPLCNVTAGLSAMGRPLQRSGAGCKRTGRIPRAGQYRIARPWQTLVGFRGSHLYGVRAM